MDEMNGLLSVPEFNGGWVECWVDESHQITADIVKNPVERGVDIADHYQIKPKQLSVRIGVSNTPILGVESGNAVGVGMWGVWGENRVDNARNYFFDIINNRLLVTVQTLVGGLYENMAITSLNWEAKNSTKSTIFTLSLEEVRVVETRKSEYKYNPDPVKEPIVEVQVQKQQDNGKVKGKRLPKPDKKGGTTTGGDTGVSDQARANAAQRQFEKNNYWSGGIGKGYNTGILEAARKKR